MWNGEVVAIFIAPEKTMPLVSQNEVLAVTGKGLEGNRYFKQVGTYSDRVDPGRQVTLIELETIDALDADLGIDFSLGDSRRNIVTRGMALNDLVGQELRIGGVRVRCIRLCEPRAYMQNLTQEGVLDALAHRGGVNAEILDGGVIRVGDSIEEG